VKKSFYEGDPLSPQEGEAAQGGVSLDPPSLFDTATPTGFKKKFLKKFSWKIPIFGPAIDPVFLNGNDERRRPRRGAPAANQ